MPAIERVRQQHERMGEQVKSNLEHALGWLGRQVGHVVRAVRQPVGEKVVYRHRQVDEAPLPGRPEVKLRRTTTDEVIVEPAPSREGRDERRGQTTSADGPDDRRG